jgi:hypothetical protein
MAKSENGKVYLFLGGPLNKWNDDTTSSAYYTFVGNESRAYFGDVIYGTGDIDNNGLNDFIVSSRVNDFNTSGIGKAFVFFSFKTDSTNSEAKTTSINFPFLNILIITVWANKRNKKK